MLFFVYIHTLKHTNMKKCEIIKHTLINFYMYHPDQSYDISMAKAEEEKIKQFNQNNISDEKIKNKNLIYEKENLDM